MSMSRYVAAQVVQSVMSGKFLTESLEMHLVQLEDPRDKALVQAICFGIFRNYLHFESILNHLLTKRLKQKDQDIHALLLVGLFQLAELRIPIYAVVKATVDAADLAKKHWACGLVNAILRNYIRQKDQLEQLVAQDPAVKYAHPSWLIEEIKHAWPLQWEAIMAANNAHPPFALRVNQQMLTRDAYLALIKEAKVIPETKHGLIVEPQPVDALPGFYNGQISVQDGAAQLAAELLMLAPGQRVLDACAAPGGKLLHILETEPNLLQCVAIEKNPQRMLSIKDNLKRMQMSAELICDDVINLSKYFQSEAFDRILLDAPCSASGVIRRHPEIKWLRKPEDIQSLAAEQYRILMSAWEYLKPDGILLYATCSIFPAENSEMIAQFLSTHQDAKEVPIEQSFGIACTVGRQILPGMHDMDGFYYARLQKSQRLN